MFWNWRRLLVWLNQTTMTINLFYLSVMEFFGCRKSRLSLGAEMVNDIGDDLLTTVATFGTSA